MTFRLGGYMVESNMGHIGDVMDPRPGADPTIYGWRAAAESARFSKHVAAVRCSARRRTTPTCGVEAEGPADRRCASRTPPTCGTARCPFMGDALDGEYGDMGRLKTVAQHFTAMFNVQRLLGPKIHGLIDAMPPGRQR